MYYFCRDITKDENIATTLISMLQISSTGENSEGAGKLLAARFFVDQQHRII